MIAEQLSQLIGADVVALQAVGGGDICAAYRAKLADRRVVFVKTKNSPPEGFFASEAGGLQRLGSVRGGVPTPEVVAYDDEHLVLEWLPSGPPSAAAAERFGRALAATHRSGAPVFGSDDGDGWIGMVTLPGGPWQRWPEMWAEGRVLPYLRAAVDRGAIEAKDAYDIERLAANVAALAGPEEPASLIHGDLWAGNVVWGPGGSAHLVDPATHGGHRESDFAMLELFGFPHLDRVRAAYHEVFPLAEGWRDRVALHQLHPVLVHAVMFGGSYGTKAGRIARFYR